MQAVRFVGVGQPARIEDVPTPSPGRGSDALILGLLVLFTALCGGALAVVAGRLLRRNRP